MLETPEIVRIPTVYTAHVWLTVPKQDMAKVLGPGLKEVYDAVAAQGVGPAGAWFIHHLEIRQDVFDFEICVPIFAPLAPVGRVKQGEIASCTVARTVYYGGYEGLPLAWPYFEAWIRGSGYAPREDLLEVYAVGPETSPNPAHWRTQLVRPLA